ncbi:MAG: cyclic lactone autoinducer peptide [Clostridia bacterium]|nr:cyclic lactone autoinducer peptide [Clostridia bacterium]
MKQIKEKMLVIVSSLVVLVGTIAASTACMIIFYQPKVPKTLKK